MNRPETSAEQVYRLLRFESLIAKVRREKEAPKPGDLVHTVSLTAPYSAVLQREHSALREALYYAARTVEVDVLNEVTIEHFASSKSHRVIVRSTTPHRWLSPVTDQALRRAGYRAALRTGAMVVTTAQMYAPQHVAASGSVYIISSDAVQVWLRERDNSYAFSLEVGDGVIKLVRRRA